MAPSCVGCFSSKAASPRRQRSDSGGVDFCLVKLRFVGKKWRKVKGLGNLEFRIFEIHPFFLGSHSNSGIYFNNEGLFGVSKSPES